MTLWLANCNANSLRMAIVQSCTKIHSKLSRQPLSEVSPQRRGAPLPSSHSSVPLATRLKRQTRKGLDQVPPIYIGHRPHCTNDTAKSAERRSRDKMEHLVRDVSFLAKSTCPSANQHKLMLPYITHVKPRDASRGLMRQL
jgi:hypothetical protein